MGQQATVGQVVEINEAVGLVADLEMLCRNFDAANCTMDEINRAEGAEVAALSTALGVEWNPVKPDGNSPPNQAVQTGGEIGAKLERLLELHKLLCERINNSAILLAALAQIQSAVGSVSRPSH
jgi:hypothetical protein